MVIAQADRNVREGKGTYSNYPQNSLQNYIDRFDSGLLGAHPQHGCSEQCLVFLPSIKGLFYSRKSIISWKCARPGWSVNRPPVGLHYQSGQSTDHPRERIIMWSVNRPPFTPYQNVMNHTIMTGSIFVSASESWRRSFCNRKGGGAIPVTFHQCSCPRTAN